MSHTPLILGCASMLGFTPRLRAIAALESAMALGIHRFDVARSYGYGQAERLLGDFFRANRKDVEITSKYGIAPASGLRANAIRMLRGRWSGLRHLQFRKLADTQDGASDFWSPGSLLRGLDQSLRELRTEYLDEFLLHSPPMALAQRDALFGAVEQMLRAGKIRRFGVCTDAQTMLVFAARLQCAQISFNLTHPAPPQLPCTVSKSINHVFAGRTGRALILARLQSALQPELLAAAQLDESWGKCKLDENGHYANEAILRVSLQAAGALAAVVAMNDPAHQQANVAAFTKPQLPEQLIQFFANTLFNPDINKSNVGAS
jgi:aryl-alcohol dehydrogenase-like predicted oxidoreductase